MMKDLLLALSLIGAGHLFMVISNWCLKSSDNRDDVPGMYLSLIFFASGMAAFFCWVALFLLIFVKVGGFA